MGGRGSVPCPGSPCHSIPGSPGLPPVAGALCPLWIPLRAPCPGASPVPCSDCSRVSSLLPLQGWKHGCVFINGRNLGRYWNIGPQEALYLPGSWLQPGTNEVGGPSSPLGLRPALTPGLLILQGSPFLPPPCLSFQIVLFEKEKSSSDIYSTDTRRWVVPGPDSLLH